jgi:hypothetical protein
VSDAHAPIRVADRRPDRMTRPRRRDDPDDHPRRAQHPLAPRPVPAEPLCA